jgi:hypothetical protein
MAESKSPDQKPEVRKQFTNTEVASKYEYTGSWTVHDKEKRIAWPGTYDGLLCDITPEVAQKMVDGKYPGMKVKEAGKAKEVSKS